MTQTILTIEGKRRIQEELDWIKSKKMEEVRKRLAAAEQAGDEWAIYDAKDEFSFYRKRIPILEKMLATAKVIGQEVHP